MQHYDALTNSEIDARITERIHNERNRRRSRSKKGTGRGVHPLPVFRVAFRVAWCHKMPCFGHKTA